jgi:hypothetical protein
MAEQCERTLRNRRRNVNETLLGKSNRLRDRNETLQQGQRDNTERREQPLRSTTMAYVMDWIDLVRDKDHRGLL